MSILTFIFIIIAVNLLLASLVHICFLNYPGQIILPSWIYCILDICWHLPRLEVEIYFLKTLEETGKNCRREKKIQKILFYRWPNSSSYLCFEKLTCITALKGIHWGYPFFERSEKKCIIWKDGLFSVPRTIKRSPPDHRFEKKTFYTFFCHLFYQKIILIKIWNFYEIKILTKRKV